jgi:hypothetical protein
MTSSANHQQLLSGSSFSSVSHRATKLPTPKSNKSQFKTNRVLFDALMKWLNKNAETHIDSFEFKKLPRLSKVNEAILRATPTNGEYATLDGEKMYCSSNRI